MMAGLGGWAAGGGGSGGGSALHGGCQGGPRTVDRQGEVGTGGERGGGEGSGVPQAWPTPLCAPV